MKIIHISAKKFVNADKIECICVSSPDGKRGLIQLYPASEGIYDIRFDTIEEAEQAYKDMLVDLARKD